MQEWNFFLRGDSAVEDAGAPPAAWLSQTAWSEIAFLDATMPGLQGIKESLSTDRGWSDWGGSEAPQDKPLPAGPHLCLFSHTIPPHSATQQTIEPSSRIPAWRSAGTARTSVANPHTERMIPRTV